MKNSRNVVGPQVRKIRNEKNLSQSQLSALLQRAGFDISRETLAKIESQIRWVSDWEIWLLAEALEVSIETLFPNAKVMPKTVREFASRLGTNLP